MRRTLSLLCLMILWMPFAVSAFNRTANVGSAGEFNTTQEVTAASQNISSSEMLIPDSVLSSDYARQAADTSPLINSLSLARSWYMDQQYDSALTYGQTALALAKRLHLPRDESEASRILYEVTKATGQYDIALVYHERYVQLRDSLYKDDLKQQIGALNEQFRQQEFQTHINTLNEEHNRLWIRIYTVAALILLLLLALAMYILHSRHRQRTLALKTEMMISHDKQLKDDVEYQDKELMVNALHLLRLHDVSYQVATRLKQLRLHATPENMEALNSLITDLEHGATAVAWEEFETRFRKVHEDFDARLRIRYPDLTPTEMKICSFLRLNLTTKDIASLTNRSVRTVENTRNRIRHKMNLSDSDNLTSVLMSV